ncbi:MAG: SDR family oxidoreductase [Myxococcales bacterium]|nr:SDR family oxidoreductase [Myxococcales bacterium]
MKRYEGKVAVITGGNSGIGYATAERLRDEGAKVVIVGRSEDKVQEAAKRLGEGAVGLTADVSKNEDLDRLYGELKKRHDHIDLLFANAGVAFFAPLEQVTAEHFDTQTAINQRGLFFTIQKALPLLRDGSSVVINTSVVNEIGMETASVYSATKAAARNLARGLAAELAPRGIRVNAVAPGPIETPIFDKAGMGAAEQQGFAEQLVPQIPLKRFGKPTEIAAAVAFLGSGDASFITGAEIPVDGGLTQV